MTQDQLTNLSDRLYSYFRLCHPERGLTPYEQAAFRLWQRVVRVRATQIDRLVGRATTREERRARAGWAGYVERERAILGQVAGPENT